MVLHASSGSFNYSQHAAFQAACQHATCGGLSAGQHAAFSRQLSANQLISKGLEIGENAAHTDRAVAQSAARHEPQRQQAEMLTSRLASSQAAC
jgi:hypothetical protein